MPQVEEVIDRSSTVFTSLTVRFMQLKKVPFNEKEREEVLM